MPGYRKTMNLLSLSVCAIACLSLAACSARQAVRPGDKAQISFDCRLTGGELAATTRTDPSVAGEPKAPLYVPRTGPETVRVTAGTPPSRTAGRDRLSFESEIIERLAERIVDLHEGERAQFGLSAEPYPASASDADTVQLATVRKRKKELRLTKEEFQGKTGRAPVAGEPFVIDKMVPGEVSELAGDEVVIRFAPVKGKELSTPFGTVTVREQEDHYELVIAAQKGRLLRTGNMVGRIGSVDNGTMTVDYGHPFAGERLACEVKVVRVEPAPAVSVPDPAMARQLEDALRRMNGDGVPAGGADTKKAEGEAH